MNQIKNSFSSIEQMTSKLCQPTGKTSGSSQAKGSFQEILFGKNQEETGQEIYALPLRFSKHANETFSREPPPSGPAVSYLTNHCPVYVCKYLLIALCNRSHNNIVARIHNKRVAVNH